MEATYSKRPSKRRMTVRPPKFCTIPVKVMMIPHETMRLPRYHDGRVNFSRIMLLGISG